MLAHGLHYLISDNVRQSAEGEIRQQLSKVKLVKKDKTMNTKTLITTMALAGALMASTSVVKANALLTITSGGQTFSATGLTQSDITLTATFTDGWTSTTTTGFADNAPLAIDVGEAANGTTGASLTICYTDGYFAEHGDWSLSTFSVGSSDLSVVAHAYSTGAGSLAWQSMGTPGYVSDSGSFTSALGYYGETICITPGKDKFQSASVDSYFNFTPVPDSGATLTLLGSMFLGIASLRSKFGSKRA
jgi:hypothetical protein